MQKIMTVLLNAPSTGTLIRFWREQMDEKWVLTLEVDSEYTATLYAHSLN